MCSGDCTLSFCQDSLWKWPAVAYVFPQKLTSLLTAVFQETIRVNVMMLKTSGEFHKGQVCLVFVFIQWINMQWNKVCMWMQMHCFVWRQSVWSVFLWEQNCSMGSGTTHSFCLSFFQVVFNITYVNGQVYLNDFPMKSGVAHVTCQTIICEYSLSLFFFFFPLGYLASLLSSNQSLQWLHVLLLCKTEHRRSK